MNDKIIAYVVQWARLKHARAAMSAASAYRAKEIKDTKYEEKKALAEAKLTRLSVEALNLVDEMRKKGYTFAKDGPQGVQTKYIFYRKDALALKLAQHEEVKQTEEVI